MEKINIEYQVMQAIAWYKKMRREQPDFIGEVIFKIRPVTFESLKKYAEYSKEYLHRPSSCLNQYWVLRQINDKLRIYIETE